jgi:hypothetical protein
VVITGKGKKAVELAKANLLKRLQKQAEVELAGIPSEHFPAIIGRGGETLRNIQAETGTRIKIPPADEVGGVIRISGSIDGCSKVSQPYRCCISWASVSLVLSIDPPPPPMRAHTHTHTHPWSGADDDPVHV